MYVHPLLRMHRVFTKQRNYDVVPTTWWRQMAYNIKNTTNGAANPQDQLVVTAGRFAALFGFGSKLV